MLCAHLVQIDLFQQKRRVQPKINPDLPILLIGALVELRPKANHPHRHRFQSPGWIQSAHGFCYPQIPGNLKFISKVVMQSLRSFGHRLLGCGLLDFLFLVDPLVERCFAPGDRVSSCRVHPRRPARIAKLLQYRNNRRSERSKAKIGEPKTQIQPVSHVLILKLQPLNGRQTGMRR